MKNHQGSADYIKEKVKKLGLWHTRTFKPILNHDELENIMSTFGFIGLPPCTTTGHSCAWKEYKYVGSGPTSPKPRLPYPRVDGLHILTYVPFLDAVNFHLQMTCMTDLFHVRGMPLNSAHDRNMRWRRMEDDENSMFLYRYGTLDQTVHSFSLHNYQQDILDLDSDGSDSRLIHKHETSIPPSQSVPLKDIITYDPYLDFEHQGNS